ncbi:IS1-like element transposase [Xenorhabdus sp. KK7.4]|uniref:IS1-like element transposase n=1 Tax=Xenorhabdus sp. KK7.4 TaxID=1851572 RepID=UPI000C0493DD
MQKQPKNLSRYNGHKPGMKEKIMDMAMNGSGVKDTGRVLGLGINTVIRTLKNARQNK